MTAAHDAPRDYLTLALRRMRLPISVKTGRDLHGHFILIQDNRIRTVPRLSDVLGLWNAGWPHLTSSPAEATRTYLNLVRTLDPTAV
jgi:hypothetical protein